MPYRRLPNTDAARLRALQTVCEKGKELPPFKLAFTQSTFQKIQSFLPLFEKSVSESKQAWDNYIKKNRNYTPLMKKAKMYISHFIQVMNLSIIRGEIPQNVRSIYGFEEDERKLPQLVNETEILEWGARIIKAEMERTLKGGNPVTNPSIALVKVRYENFKDACESQKVLKKNADRLSSEVAILRKTADELILKVWNEIEESYKDLTDNEKRQRASNYGIVYVYRPNEPGKFSPLDRALNGFV